MKIFNPPPHTHQTQTSHSFSHIPESGKFLCLAFFLEGKGARKNTKRDTPDRNKKEKKKKRGENFLFVLFSLLRLLLSFPLSKRNEFLFLSYVNEKRQSRLLRIHDKTEGERETLKERQKAEKMKKVFLFFVCFYSSFFFPGGGQIKKTKDEGEITTAKTAPRTRASPRPRRTASRPPPRPP